MPRRPGFIGLIADTHGLLRPEALTALEGAAHVIHAGDVGRAEILLGLARLAPVTAVRGNNDRGAWAEDLPETALVRVGRRRVFVVHELAHLSRHDVGDADVVVVGHSHAALVEPRPGYLLVNPGSAGPRRFRLPVTVARLSLAGAPSVEIVHIPLP